MQETFPQRGAKQRNAIERSSDDFFRWGPFPPLNLLLFVGCVFGFAWGSFLATARWLSTCTRTAIPIWSTYDAHITNTQRKPTVSTPAFDLSSLCSITSQPSLCPTGGRAGTLRLSTCRVTQTISIHCGRLFHPFSAPDVAPTRQEQHFGRPPCFPGGFRLQKSPPCVLFRFFDFPHVPGTKVWQSIRTIKRFPMHQTRAPELPATRDACPRTQRKCTTIVAKRPREKKDLFAGPIVKIVSPRTGKFLIPIKYRNCNFFSVS